MDNDVKENKTVQGESRKVDPGSNDEVPAKGYGRTHIEMKNLICHRLMGLKSRKFALDNWP